jgi:predicted amidophosphoribosyltransferase
VNDPTRLLRRDDFEASRFTLNVPGNALQPDTKQCPDCAEPIAAEAKVCKHCGYRFRVCPDCAEPVLPEARVCKHCGFRFDAEPSVT